MVPSESEAISEIEHECHTDDEEVDHERADRILCDFVSSLGYTKLVKTFEDVKKYYA